MVVVGMKPILVANAGSASLAVSLISGDGIVASSEYLDPWNGAAEAAHDAVKTVLERAGIEPAYVGHRFVHGGSVFERPTVIDWCVKKELHFLTPLAPIHQTRALVALDAFEKHLPDKVHVACFDTAFHRTLVEAARTYAVPESWRAKYGIARYGFHGLSHQAVGRCTPHVLGRPCPKLVSCHLGGGSSVCAILNGRSIDTTMGFTPLEGLIMKTRSGSIDPGIIFRLIDDGVPVADVRRGIESTGGLAALSQTDGDIRTILEQRNDGDHRARIAFDAFVRSIAHGIAAMATSLEGLDTIAFTGGMGSNVPALRAAVGTRLRFLGVDIEPAKNEHAVGTADISADDASVSVVVAEAREDLEIALQINTLMP
jgi:acetate kinase